jgi:hypothetical protein
MQRALAALLTLALAGPGMKALARGPKVRQVRVQRHTASSLRIAWTRLRGGLEPTLTLNDVEPIVVGETFDVIGQNGNLGRVVVDKVTVDDKSCLGTIVYQAEARLGGPTSLGELGEVYAVQAPEPLDHARLLHDWPNDPDFRLPDNFSPSLVVDLDGNGTPDLVRGEGACRGGDQACWATFARVRGGLWSMVGTAVVVNDCG